MVVSGCCGACGINLAAKSKRLAGARIVCGVIRPG